MNRIKLLVFFVLLLGYHQELSAHMSWHIGYISMISNSKPWIVIRMSSSYSYSVQPN